MKQAFTLIAVGAALLMGASAQAGSLSTDLSKVALTGNNTAPANWRVADGQAFNGTTFDGVARIAFDNDGDLTNGFSVCSGTLLAGGKYVVTAAHCADDFNVMTVQFGVHGNVSKETRGVEWAKVHEQWTGALGYGTDIAILKLDEQVTSIDGFKLSRTNDIGKDFLIMGHGTTSQGGNFGQATNWNDWGWAHWGTNTADITNDQWDTGLGGVPTTNPFMEYIADFDGPNGTYNGLQVVNDFYTDGNQWSSGTGTGANEALIAGGDSGGGDFIWNGSEWVLSGVHSWGINLYSGANSASWGDLSGSTAVVSHYDWLMRNAVPEPASLAITLLGLLAAGGASRRRKSVA